jgi:hypothetical protein
MGRLVKNKFLMSFIFILALVPVSIAYSEDESILYQKRNVQLELEKKSAEADLREKVIWTITPYLKDVKFDISVELILRDGSLPSIITKGGEAGDVVDLGKLGASALPIREELIDYNNLKKNIVLVKMNLVLYDFVDEQRLFTTITAAKHTIKLVPYWRIKMNTINAPKPTPFEFWKKNKWNIAMFSVLFSILLSVLVLLVKALQTPFDNWRFARRRQDEMTEINNADTASKPLFDIAPDEPQPMKSADIYANKDPMDVIPKVTPSEEKIIYDSLVKAKKYTLLKKVTSKFYPAELIFKLPEETLRNGLMQLNAQERTFVLASFPGQIRNNFVDSLGESGSKLRSFAELEISRIKSGLNNSSEILRSQEKACKKYVDLVRELIALDKNLSSMAADILDQWLYDKTGGQAGKKNDQAA